MQNWFKPSGQRGSQDEVTRHITAIRRGHPTHEGVKRLQEYGVACLEKLIIETKDTLGGDMGEARHMIFASMRASDAYPIAVPYVTNKDHAIRLSAALALSQFNYKGSEDLRSSAIGAVKYVHRWAITGVQCEKNPEWILEYTVRRLKDAIDYMLEQRVKETGEEGW